MKTFVFYVLCATSFSVSFSAHAVPRKQASCGLERFIQAFAKDLPSSLAQQIEQLGKVRSKSVGLQKQKFGTTIYHGAYPDPMRAFPEIDRSSQAVILFLGGAGTLAASGKTSMPGAHRLFLYNVSLISLDFPFHANGPRDPSFYNRDVFVDWVAGIVKHYKAAGKPLYLVGHSFGPGVIQELMSQHPGIAQGAVYLSPGGGTSPELNSYYNQQVERGAIGQYNLDHHIGISAIGEHWSDAIGEVFRENKGQPVNIQEPVLLLAGDKDAWSTPDILRTHRARYPHMDLSIIQAGHDLFRVRGKEDRIYIEKIVSFINQTSPIKIELSAKTKFQEQKIELRLLHENSDLFRSWLAQWKKPLDAYLRKPRATEGILQEWERWVAQEMQRLAKEKQQSNPEEYSNFENKEHLLKALEKPSDDLTEWDVNFLMQFLSK